MDFLQNLTDSDVSQNLTALGRTPALPGPQSVSGVPCHLGGAISDIDNILLYISIFISAVVVIVYGFIKKRKRVWRNLHTPGIVIPVNLIQSTPERWVYVFMFGAVSGELLISILTNGYGFTSAANSSITGSTANTIFIMFLISFTYYPAFASIRAPIPLLGYFVGVFQCVILFLSTYLRISRGIQQCLGVGTMSSLTFGYIVIASIIPVSLSHSIVILWYVWKIGYESFRLCTTKKSKLEALFELPTENRPQKHVKWLLSKWTVDSDFDDSGDHQSNAESHGRKFGRKLVTLYHKLRPYFYKWDPHFYFPLRFLAAMIIMVYIVYILTFFVLLVLIVYVVPVVRDIQALSDEVQSAVMFVQTFRPDDNSVNLSKIIVSLNNSLNLSHTIITVYDIVRSSALGVGVVLPAGPAFSFIFCIVLLLQMMSSVRVHLKKIAKGNFHFLPKKLASPAYRLVHSVQFVGFQIGYFTWAWILLTFFVWTSGLVGLLSYFLLNYFLGIVLSITLAVALPLVYSFALYYIQLIFIKLFFVGDVHNKHVVINNIRLFHWFSYVMVFQNAVVGLTSAFLRIVYAILFGLLLLFRLDRVVLMKGFEKFDKGHKSYIGFLYLEHTLNNPVLLTFTELLLKECQQKKLQGVEELEEISQPGHHSEESLSLGDNCEFSPQSSRRARNRWKVCYTLLRNPTLQNFTATYLAATREKLRKRKARPNSMELSNFSRDEAQEELVPQDCVEGLAPNDDGQVDVDLDEAVQVPHNNTVPLEEHNLEVNVVPQQMDDTTCIVTAL